METNEQTIPEVPEGKVKTINGEIIDRLKACRVMRQSPEHNHIFFDHNGTEYHCDKNGTMKRVGPKYLVRKKK